MNKLLMGLIPLAALVHQAEAQTRQISGRVTDRTSGEGIPGATVLVKGTTTGVSTNSDGTFSLSVPAGGGTLQISSVGYLALERPIGTDEQINIGLAADNKTLSEVVVTGYGGSQDVKDITGSVAQIKSDKINNQPVQSFEQSLTGRLAGVQVTNPGGTLADGVSVRIRGANSISGSSQPLYVIDGVPISTRDNANVFNAGNGTRYNPLADINPNDIESVEVLKDASAAAIYGSRAANGVIVITTKRGKAGKTNVSINSWAGLVEPTRTLDLLNATDFITIQNEKRFNRDGATAAPLAREGDFDGDGQPDETDWQKAIFRRQYSQSHQAALSGGTDKSSYYASATYTNQRGILYTNKLKQGAVRLNVDVTPKKWLKAGINSGYTQTQNNGVLTDGFLAGATIAGYNAPPNLPIYGADGSYYLTSNGLLGAGNNNHATNVIANNFYNPIAVLETQRNTNTSRRLLANAYAEVQPVTGLRFTSRYGVDYLDNFEDQYSDPRIAGLGFSFGGLIQNNRLDRTQWNWQNYANYDKTFGEQHTVGATVGVEYQETQEQQVYTGAAGIVDPKFNSILDALYSGTQFSGGTKFGNAFRSYFGRLNYNFGSRYYAQVALRADADSRFGEQNRTGYFPGGSIGWRISEEGFMKGLTVLSDLKLRASYGLVGNSGGIGSYASRPTLIGGGQYADANGLSITQIGNEAIKWETSRKLNIGVDFALFNSRIGGTFDFFNNDISGLLLNAPIPTQLGIPNPVLTNPNGVIPRNVGSMYNRGIEFGLNTTNVEMDNGFRWNTSLNLTILKNHVTGLNDPADLPSGVQRASIGRSLGVYQLIRWAGVNPDNGNAQFLDKDGNVKQYDALAQRWFNAAGEPTTAITQADALYTKKTGYPTYYGGFDNTLSFKGLELTVFLQYSGGNMVYNATRAGLMTTSMNNNLTEILDRWQAPGDQTDVQKLVLRDNVSTQASTRWLEKGDFIRLRQVGLGYNLPTTLSERVGLQNVRLYTQVQNALIFTKYKGADPEVNSNRNNTNIGYGIDNRSVPQTRTYTVGLNLSL